MIKRKSEFKYKHFEGEVILWAVRWYGQFAVERYVDEGLSISEAVHKAAEKFYGDELCIA